MREPALRRTWHWGLGMALGLALSACKPDAASAPQADVQFGIFYGGQIQQRTELPFELNAALQQQGFRIVWAAPLPEKLVLNWEISRPGPTDPKNPVARPEQRVTELGQAELPAGQQRFVQPLLFRPGDPLGMWNLRIVAGQQLLLDRVFTVYDAAARRRDLAASRVPDAGP